MLKKVLSIFAACAMCIGLSVSAFAISAGDAFDIEVENPDQQTSEQKEFTIGSVTFNDYVNYIPAGDKVTITAKTDGLTINIGQPMEDQIVYALLYDNDQYGPVASEGGMKIGEKLYYTVKESDEIQLIRVESIKDDQFWPIYIKSAAAGDVVPEAASTEASSESVAVPESSSIAPESSSIAPPPSSSSVAPPPSSSSVAPSASSADIKPAEADNEGAFPVVPVVVGVVAVAACAGGVVFFLNKRK